MKAKMAASSSAHIQKMSFSASLLIAFIITSCLSVKVDEETKVFIRLVIENGNKESTCFSNGPVRAFHCSLYIYPSPRWVNSADKPIESTEENKL